MDDVASESGLQVRLNPPALTPLERERQAFLRLLPQLLADHRGRFVAIYREQVVDVGDDREALILRVWARVGYVPIYVERVDERPERIERIPHYRLAPQEER